MMDALWGHLEADQVSDVMLGGCCNKLKARKERGNAWNLRSDADLGVFGLFWTLVGETGFEPATSTSRT